ncbi:MAG: SUMF1/EgtB/PvdO family nonheme iron enzyme, partial [Myxococcota bacterium]
MLIAAGGLGQPEREHGSCPLAESAIGSFVRVDGGGFVQGAGRLYAEEGHPRQVFVSSFLLQINEVTNDDFAAFVAATGYVTDAEKGEGSARFVATATPGDAASWWRLDPGATWRTPEGAESDLRGKGRHPVVHVTLRDARAYAAWAGGRLPNEAEWEIAASRGLLDPREPESGARGPHGEFRANVWTGPFPTFDTAEDGHAGSAPVGSFAASRIATYDHRPPRSQEMHPAHHANHQ